MNNSTKYNNDLNVIGSIIREYRIKASLSQADLANKLELLGISMTKNSVQKIESHSRIIKDFELAAIAKVLKVSPDVLLKDFIHKLK